MARIRILELPTQVLGEQVTTPFALIIDQVEVEETRALGGTLLHATSELTQAEADDIAARIGAVGAVLTVCSLDFDQ